MSDDRLERIENKLDKVVDEIGIIKTTLAVNTDSLVHHIKRTDLLQTEMGPMRDHLAQANLKKATRQALMQITKWAASIVSAAAAVAAIVLKLMGKI